MKPARSVAVALMVGLAGCASARGEEATPHPARSNTVLTQEDISASGFSNLYEAVSALRPNWLVFRGPLSFQDPDAGQVVVYLNSAQAGGAEQLRQLSVLEVSSVRYYDPIQASSLFGIRQKGGAAIVVNTMP